MELPMLELDSFFHYNKIKQKSKQYFSLPTPSRNLQPIWRIYGERIYFTVDGLCAQIPLEYFFVAENYLLSCRKAYSVNIANIVWL